MIYEHFVNKEELYKTVLSGVYSRLAEYEKKYYTKDIPPDAAIRNIVHVSFSFLEKNPSFVRILMWENLLGAKNLEVGGVAEMKNPTIKYIKEKIREGKKQGLFSPDVDEEQTVISLLNFEFSYFSNIHTLSGILGTDLADSVEISKRAAFVADMFMKYLSSRD
jgi:TetR/AcrR family transcriptional regulator